MSFDQTRSSAKSQHSQAGLQQRLAQTVGAGCKPTLVYRRRPLSCVPRSALGCSTYRWSAELQRAGVPGPGHRPHGPKHSCCLFHNRCSGKFPIHALSQPDDQNAIKASRFRNGKLLRLRKGAQVSVCQLQVASYCGNWQAKWRFRHIPGPPTSFPLGNMKTIQKKEIFRAHQDWSAEYGDVCRVFMVRRPVILVTGKHLRRVFRLSSTRMELHSKHRQTCAHQ